MPWHTLSLWYCSSYYWTRCNTTDNVCLDLQNCCYSLYIIQRICVNHTIQLPMQSVPITTNNVSSSPVHVEVYSIQHYVIKFVSDCDGSVVLSVYFDYLHKLNWPPWYNSNIVDSGVKHHKPNKTVLIY
jgi:hypothetical protein